jgi:hypothetical protein
MTVTPRNHPRALPVLATAITIVVVTIVANRLMGTSGQTGPQLASQTTVGVAAEKPAPTPKERGRYQATIDNWQRYNAATTAEAR